MKKTKAKPLTHFVFEFEQLHLGAGQMLENYSNNAQSLYHKDLSQN